MQEKQEESQKKEQVLPLRPANFGTADPVSGSLDQMEHNEYLESLSEEEFLMLRQRLKELLKAK